MKNLNYIKIVFTMILLIDAAEGACFPLNNGPSDIVTGVPKMTVSFEMDTGLPSSTSKVSTPHLEMSRLPIPRELVPPSLKNRITQVTRRVVSQKNSNLECNENNLCASFDSNTTSSDVSAWMGFETVNNFGKFFVATYGQKVNHLGNNVYSTEQWDEKHFWINIGKNTIPLPMQPRFVGKDEESGSEWHTVDYIGYRRTGIDYSNYPDNMSLSSLVLLINPKTQKVEDYYIEYYDENDVYVDDYELKIGDEIESYFLGFKKGEEDAVYFFNLEKMKPVTDPVTFSYKKQFPGKDFNCTYCNEIDLENVELKYIFEAYGETRSNFTEPQPVKTKTNASGSSSSKSVPISGFWMFFILSILISIVTFKNDHKLHKV